MASLDDRPQCDTRTPILTVGDLAAMPDELPSGTVHYELDNGRLVMMSPPGNRHGAIQSIIIGELLRQGQWLGLGEVRTESGVILWRNPDRVVGPDVMFIAAPSLPIQESSEGYLTTIPELFVEVRSKNDSVAYYEQKTRDYLTAGAVLVWFADPFAETVTVTHRDEPAKVLEIGDTLTAEGIIPGFSFALEELFRT